jgi:YidC/Oxa1 family membrane protein insertase
MSTIFHLFFYDPLYNALIFILSVLPHPNVGIAVIILTVIVRLVLFPLSRGAVVTQMKLREVEPEVKALREKYKDNKEKQAQELIALYRTNKINPFASFLFLLIQLPIIFALYFIFFRGGLPNIDMALLYSFVTAPGFVDMHLGWFDISKPQVIFGALAAGTQFLQAQLSIPPHKPAEKQSFQDDLARSMNIQIRYVLPVIVFAISFTLSGAVALYWITGNIFTILQELYIRRTLTKKETK